MNGEWLRFTGREAARELGDGWQDGLHPDDHGALDRHPPFEAELRLRGQDGGYRWLLARGRARDAGNGLIVSLTDVHGRRASDTRFRDMADTAPVMIWTTDPAGEVTFVNERWLAFTGTVHDEEMGASFALGVHPEDVVEVLTSWEAALAEQLPWGREYRLLRADGEYRWILDQGVPHFDDGAFTGYVGTAIEINERRLMEGELRRLLAQEHGTAETLQRSLLPASLPEIEGLAMAARYLPAAAGTAVGGDWYDALTLPDGRVAVVVGDVVGHGLRAAAAMGQLRNAFRAYALTAESPAEIMAAVNRLAGAGGEPVMATAALLVIDRDSGRLTFASAGHPPPLVVEDGAARFLEGARAVPVGATENATFREDEARLAPGAALVLYTDGLVERRGERLGQNLEQLAANAATADADDLEQLCDQILARAVAAGRPADDIALIAVRPEPVSPAGMWMELPADPDAIATLRRRLIRFLEAAGAGTQERHDIVLAVAEAAANASEHAYGPGEARFEVEVRKEGGDVVAEVRDRGNWRPQRGTDRGRGLKLIRGLMDSAEIEAGESGTVARMRRRLEAR